MSAVIKWLSSSSGRSKRSAVVDKGCYMLEHEATGRFYIGKSTQVSSEVDRHLDLLSKDKHPHKLLQGLYRGDNEIRVYEYPTKSNKVVMKLLGDLLDEQVNDYMCVNPEVIRPPKKKRK